jgi:glutaminyl-peptide cyclotransferase
MLDSPPLGMSLIRSLPLLSAAAALLAGTLMLSHCGDPEPSGPQPPAPVTSTGAEAAYEHTRNIVSFGPRPPGSAALRKTRAYLTAQLKASGWQVGSQQFTAPTPGGEKTFINLLARFDPEGDPDLWTRPATGILACHIDSKVLGRGIKFVGADDAASAAGLLLELARQLAATPERARQLEIVFFDGEESIGPSMSEADGIYGSRRYATRWMTAATKPTFGIVFDMIGHRDLQVRYPPDSPDSLATLLRQSAEAEGAAKRFAPAPTPILDDHVPLNNAGIPTIDIIGDFANSDWWHTQSDNLALISRESLDLTLRIATRMLDSLLAAQ